MNLANLLLDFIKEADFNAAKLMALKRSWAKTSRQPLLRNSDLFRVYQELLKKKKLKPNKVFEDLLRLKKIRTLSGVSPVAVLTKPYPCPGRCIYCPDQKNLPKSYLGDEPAVLRAQALNFDAYAQVRYRLKQYEAIGHQPEKVELIVMGGTWSVLPRDYKIEFITQCFATCNQNPKNQKVKIKDQNEKLKFKNLRSEQRRNELAKYRIVGITLETRPDYINEKEIKLMRKLGCTRVELGVQSIYDDVLKKIKRGHKVSATIKATKLLKDAGFKICYHLMPNLPGSNPEKDLAMFKTIFTDSRFKPDMIKIYPCVVTYQSELYRWYQQGKFKPYPDEELISLLSKIKKIVPEWVRINRLGRDIPVANIAAGTKISNIRQVLKTACQCIRCREIKNSKLKIQRESLKLKISQYQASGGEEYFLQYVDEQNRLYALLRLRLVGQRAIIREVHTFGQALAISKKEKDIQHQGLGKKLISIAEKIAAQKGFKKLAVIAAVGTRNYYRQLAYQLRDTYMVKRVDI